MTSLSQTPGQRFARDCPVCQKAKDHVLLYVKWGYGIARCEGCGLGSTIVDPDFDPGAIYDAGYFSGQQRDGYRNYRSSETVLRAEFHKLVEHIASQCKPNGRLLEVGCAYGFFLLEAQKHFRCTGLEVCGDAVKQGRERGLDVHEGIVDADFLDRHGPFDVIVMLDVIEHLPEPGECVRLLSRALAPGGLLVITTGDWNSLLSKVMGRRWRLMTPPQHLYFFSRQNLPMLVEDSGCRVLECRHPWKTVPAGLAAFQVLSRVGVPLPLPRFLDRVGIPVNLFDAMRLVARKEAA